MFLLSEYITTVDEDFNEYVVRNVLCVGHDEEKLHTIRRALQHDAAAQLIRFNEEKANYDRWRKQHPFPVPKVIGKHLPYGLDKIRRTHEGAMFITHEPLTPEEEAYNVEADRKNAEAAMDILPAQNAWTDQAKVMFPFYHEGHPFNEGEVCYSVEPVLTVEEYLQP